MRAVPTYRLHKQSGQAIVTLSGRDHLLGPYGSDKSRQKYDRLTGAWQANGRCLTRDTPALTISTLISRYWTFAQGYYAGTKSAGELAGIRLALAHVRRLYGDEPVAAFGPLALKAVREAMTAAGWSRTYTNAQAGRVKRLFAWAVEMELAPPSSHHALLAVRGLRFGRTEARETEPVRPVAAELVDPVRQIVSRHVRAMIDVQLVTGARPGEVCSMTAAQIDQSGAGNWTYRPTYHKTLHHGHDRVILIGPKAQAVLCPFLLARLTTPDAPLFSPRDAEEERHASIAAARAAAAKLGNATPLNQGNRRGTNRKRHPKRTPGDKYSVGAYRQAIVRACATLWPADKAKHWHPHQLRHNAATRLRRQHGLEAAQIILGHKTLTVTQVYAERDMEVANRVVAVDG